MPKEPRLIITAPPSSASEASSHGFPIGHIAYRIGNGGHLLRSNIPINLRGGLMVIDHHGYDGRGDTNRFCQQVLRECTVRNFDGAILDFEHPQHPALGQIVNMLASMFAKRGWPLYVTEPYASVSNQTQIMIPSALSGGSLNARLTEAINRYGTERIALGIQRVAEDFTLPAPSGCGTPLSREELSQRIKSRNASVFFSDELCAYYFTYMSRHSGAHFVLFDNAASIRKKIIIAKSLNLSACILAWPEVQDIIGTLFP